MAEEVEGRQSGGVDGDGDVYKWKKMQGRMNAEIEEAGEIELATLRE